MLHVAVNEFLIKSNFEGNLLLKKKSKVSLNFVLTFLMLSAFYIETLEWTDNSIYMFKNKNNGLKSTKESYY